jgi:hypothetical protein
MGLLQAVLDLEDEQQYFIYTLFNDAGSNSITHSMELSPSSDTASRSATPEILNIL